MIRRLSTLLFSCFLFASSLPAQTAGTPYVFEVAGPQERLGADVAVIGDINGNGSDDLVIGSPGFSVGSITVGRLRAVDGLTLQQLWVTTGTVFNSGLGNSIERVPDIDGDGIDDVVSGEVGSNMTRLVSWYSGATGALLSTQSVAPLSTAGNLPAVIPWRDWNGDGTIDYAVGDLVDPAGQRTVAVLDRMAGVLATATLPQPPFGFGGASLPPIALLGSEDLNGDGISDLVIGDATYSSPGILSRGSIDALDGATLQTLWSRIGTQIAGGLGASLCSAVDLDNDGIREVVAGEPGDGLPLVPNTGRLRVLSGATGIGILDLVSPTLDLRSLGRSCVNLNSAAPSLSEVIVAASLPSDATQAAGPALLQFRLSATFPGPTGIVIREIETQFTPANAIPTLASGDVNADGIVDLALGIQSFVPQRSSVHVFRGSGALAFPGPNPMNQTLQLFNNSASLQLQSFWQVSGAPASVGLMPGLIVAGLARSVAPVFATTLLVDVSVPGTFVTLPFQFNFFGNGVVDVAAPGSPVPAITGLTLFAQAFAVDLAFPQGLISSNGLQITL